MKMQMILSAAILFPLVLNGALAQQPQHQKEDVLIYRSVQSGPLIHAAADQAGSITGVGPNVLFMGGEFMVDAKPITGAPYSAESVNETVQTLSDGNRIIQSSSSKVYRDSAGRVRRESEGNASPAGPFFFQFSGSAGSGGAAVAGGPTRRPPVAHAQILITDPVEGVNTMLHPGTRTAEKMSIFNISVPHPAIASAGADAKQGMATSEQGAVTIDEGGKKVIIRHLQNESSAPAPVLQSLGVKTIQGVDCEGTRTTFTIPAGQIGNVLPIVITTERWYSPQLQTEVLSTRHDPRVGDTTFKLVNIDRSEPSASLFQVPADYTVVDMAKRMKVVIQEKPVKP